VKFGLGKAFTRATNVAYAPLDAISRALQFANLHPKLAELRQPGGETHLISCRYIGLDQFCALLKTHTRRLLAGAGQLQKDLGPYRSEGKALLPGQSDGALCEADHASRVPVEGIENAAYA